MAIDIMESLRSSLELHEKQIVAIDNEIDELETRVRYLKNLKNTHTKCIDAIHEMLDD